MKDNKEKVRFRYRLIYKAAHLIAPLMLRKYGFTTDKLGKTDGNYIVLANHLTELDMMMVCAAMKQHMYLVAGEHLLRSKHAKLICWAQDPIFEYKGDVAVDTVREIVRRVRHGSNMLIFPEGSRSFHGETLTLPESIGKLVRLAGVGLVTYRIEGGYFAAPRWAYTERTGPVRGKIVSVLSAADVAGMSKTELTDLINRDIYENAYERQRHMHWKYKGERLAEGLENYLVKCPLCGAFDPLTTQEDRFSCVSCGAEGRYTEEGFLESDAFPYDSVYDWGRWAEEETERYVLQAECGKPVFEDGDLRVFEIDRDHREVPLVSGALTGFRDRIEIGGMVFGFSDIRAMSMLYFGKTLLFTWQGRHIGITGERFHAIKYQKLYDVFSDTQKKAAAR